VIPALTLKGPGLLSDSGAHPPLALTPDPAAFDLDPAEQATFRLSAAVRICADSGAPGALRTAGRADTIRAASVLGLKFCWLALPGYPSGRY
jgi:hypothetical protein